MLLHPLSSARRCLCLAALLSPLLSGCLEKQDIVYVPDAENLLFTDQGQLLVTGGKSVVEVLPATEGSGYSSRTVGPEDLPSCNYTGMAQMGDWVFTTCVEIRWLILRNNHLLAANIRQPDFRFQIIGDPRDLADPMDAISVPNGLATSPDGALLIADYNLLADAGIARATVTLPDPETFAQATAHGQTVLPQLTGLQRNWLGPEQGLSTPNGIRVSGAYLYVTDGSSVKRFAFDAHGQISGGGVTLWQGTLAVLDDLMPYCGGVAFTSFLAGRLHYVAAYTDPETGTETFEELYATPPFSYEAPSSLAIGQGPLFNGTDLLITEKGLLQNANPKFGNFLVRSRLSEDLGDGEVCLLIQEEMRQRLAQGTDSNG